MKTIKTIALFSLLLFASTALAQGGVVTVEPLTDLPGIQQAGEGGVSLLVNTLYRYLIGIGAIAAVLIIMYGGFRYMTSEAISGKTQGREDIQRALLGLFILLSPVIVFGIINEDITKLDIDLGVLKYNSRGSSGTTIIPQQCQIYSEFQQVRLNTDTCQQALGDDWKLVGPECCLAESTEEGACCALDSTPPETIGDHSVVFVYGEALGSSQACVSYGDQDFETLQACLIEERNLIADNGVAVQVTCEGVIQTPPIPANDWDLLKDLPDC